MADRPRQKGHLSKRKLNAAATLGLTLRFLTAGVQYADFCLLTSSGKSGPSRYLRFGVLCLLKALRSLPQAVVEMPSEAYLRELGDRMSEHGEVMRGACFTTDGSLHESEKDEAATSNFFEQESHPDYNGWKMLYSKKGLYVFCFDGTISWYLINAPGSWHDAYMFDRCQIEFVSRLPQGIWMLGDTAFPIIPGKVERARKAGESLPANHQRREFQLNLEQFSSRMRLSAEWGVKDLKRTWAFFQKKLTTDDVKFNLMMWESSIRLFNVRARCMNVGQIHSVFVRDTQEPTNE